MRIEPYDSKYFENCTEIIQSNTPKYIHQSEHSDYRDYLLRDDKTYFVLFNDLNLVACGGYGLNKSQTKAGLSWGLVHRMYHDLGYGSYLLKYRLNQIKNNYPDTEIILDTSQYTYKFFEKFGFKVKTISKNAYGEGLDKYDMTLIRAL
tara:strand:- start:19 stop:465 length:447 start_codon:yes stop_codon:yes gene_type:complete